MNVKRISRQIDTKKPTTMEVGGRASRIAGCESVTHSVFMRFKLNRKRKAGLVAKDAARVRQLTYCFFMLPNITLLGVVTKNTISWPPFMSVKRSVSPPSKVIVPVVQLLSESNA